MSDNDDKTGYQNLDNFAENFRRAQAYADRVHEMLEQSGGMVPERTAQMVMPMIQLAGVYAQLAEVGLNRGGIKRVQVVGDVGPVITYNQYDK